LHFGYKNTIIFSFLLNFSYFFIFRQTLRVLVVSRKTEKASPASADDAFSFAKAKAKAALRASSSLSLRAIPQPSSLFLQPSEFRNSVTPLLAHVGACSVS